MFQATEINSYGVSTLLFQENIFSGFSSEIFQKDNPNRTDFSLKDLGDSYVNSDWKSILLSLSVIFSTKYSKISKSHIPVSTDVVLTLTQRCSDVNNDVRASTMLLQRWNNVVCLLGDDQRCKLSLSNTLNFKGSWKVLRSWSLSVLDKKKVDLNFRLSLLALYLLFLFSYSDLLQWVHYSCSLLT